MESPSRALTTTTTTTTPRSHSIRRRRTSADPANSPEFEFCNPPGLPESTLLSADELFSDGFLLPLHLLHRPEPDPEPVIEPDPEPGPEESEPAVSSSSSITSSSNPILTASKRWREIFKKKEKSDEKSEEKLERTTEKSNGSKKERKNNNNGSGNNNNNSSAAELNINIWPFSRSRSAGNNSGRSRPGSSGRKVSSAPCSRSNSSGESKSRRSWPSSPGRTGVHLGRASPVWQVRRSCRSSGEDSGRRSKLAAGKGRVLNLNVPMCIGYRQQLSCRSDENGAVAGAGESVAGSGVRSGVSGSGGNGNLFSLRGLFSKKSVLTV